MQLGQAVGPGAELVRERVLGPVPGGRRRVAEPEVGREVDHHPAAARAQAATGRAAGQGAEEHVGALLQALVDEQKAASP